MVHLLENGFFNGFDAVQCKAAGISGYQHGKCLSCLNRIHSRVTANSERDRDRVDPLGMCQHCVHHIKVYYCMFYAAHMRTRHSQTNHLSLTPISLSCTQFNNVIPSHRVIGKVGMEMIQFECYSITVNTKFTKMLHTFDSAKVNTPVAVCALRRRAEPSRNDDWIMVRSLPVITQTHNT